MSGRWWIGLWVLCLAVLYSSPGEAYPGNVPNSFGYPTGAVIGSLNGSCASCHTTTGKGPSQVQVNGHDPATNESVDLANTLPLVISFTVPMDKQKGGILVAHNDTSDNDAHGTLIQGSNTHSCKGPDQGQGQCRGTLPDGAGQLGNTEVTEAAPALAVNNVVSFSFSYQAPATTCGTFAFRAYIADVNGDTFCGPRDFGLAPVDFAINVPCPDLCKGVTCPAATDCHTAGACDPATGLCSNPSASDGTGCSGTDKCLQTYQCQAGVCVGSNLKVCAAGTQCTAGEHCNSGTGACEAGPAQPDGASCDDGDPCTQFDTCHSGTCTSAFPVVCGNPPACFDRAQCDHTTGRCGAPPPTAQGVACDDHIDSTRGDVCDGAGACGGTPLPSNVLSWGANSNTGTNGPTASNLSTANRFIQLAAGTNHVIGLRADGTVMSWGENAMAQLGLGAADVNPTRTPTAVDLSDFIFPLMFGQRERIDGVVQVAAGDQYSLALVENGLVIAWGASDKGQTGVVSSTPIAKPRSVNNEFGFVAVAAGSQHALGLSVEGTVWSWGSNDSGELGRADSGAGFDAVPGAVAGVSEVVAVAAGGATSLALRADGTVWAWGSNAFGHLGTGITAASSSSPVQVVGLSGVAKIASSPFHDLAQLSDGTVRAWGLNAFGELGVAAPGQAGNAALAQASGAVAAASQGAVHACDAVAKRVNNPAIAQACVAIAQQVGIAAALRISDAVNTSIVSAAPVTVNGLNGVIAIAAGAHHSAAVTDDGRVLSWGSNANGQLGLPISGPQTSLFSASPVTHPTMTDTAAIAAGGGQTVALKAATATLAWGRNLEGQTGSGAASETQLPLFLPNLSNAKSIAAGGLHTLAILGDGSVVACGENQGGELGTGDQDIDPSPVPVMDSQDGSGVLRHVVAVAAGAHHSLALKSDGTVWAWGDNLFGQLTGAFPIEKSPIQVTGPDGTLDWGGDGKLVHIIAISCGANHNVVLADDGTVWTWGQDTFGQIGNSQTVDAVRSPFHITGLDNGLVRMVSGGRTHTLVLTAGPAVRWAWGEDAQGELAAQRVMNTSVPVIGGFFQQDPFRFIVAGDQGSLGLQIDGHGEGWGLSGDGQLGLGFFFEAFFMTGIDGIGINFQSLALGSLHSLDLDTSGGVWSSGSNVYGQLGSPAGSDRLVSPLQIRGINGVQSVAAGQFHSVALMP